MIRGGYKVYLNKEKADFLSQSFQQNKEVVQIDDMTFFRGSVIYIMPIRDVEREERIKQGEWMCKKHNNWIPKGKSCGHCI